MAEDVGGERHGQAEVPARRGDHSWGREVGREELVERTAWLERAGVLHELQLQGDAAGKVEDTRLQFEHRGSSYVRVDPTSRGEDLFGPDDGRRQHPPTETR